MLRKYASARLEVALGERLLSSPQKPLTGFRHFGSFDFQPKPGFIYTRTRAISARVNKNYDGFPSSELKLAFKTFEGRPVFVNHNNHDTKRARGIVLSSQYFTRPDDHWIGLLTETDALTFPRLARDLIKGDLDSVSMGCFPPGAPITLADGSTKPIEKVEIGDKVITHTGKIESVTYVMKRDYHGLLYRLRVYGNNDLVSLTGEHPVWIRRLRGESTTECVCGRSFPIQDVERSRPRHSGGLGAHLWQMKKYRPTEVHGSVRVSDFEGWVKSEDLREGDYVLTPMLQMQGGPGEYHFARLLGYFLAEGNFLNYDQNRIPQSVEWTFHEHEVEYVEELRISVESLGYTLSQPLRDGSKGVSYRVNQAGELALKLLEYGGKYSWGKVLHPDVLSWSVENQKALLQAYLNGDASFQNTVSEVGSVSPVLLEQMTLVAIKCGYVVSRLGRVQDYGSVTEWCRTKGRTANLLSEISIHNLQNNPYSSRVGWAYVDTQGMWRRITQIDVRDYQGEVFNFDVDGDDSYVAHRIAVHNCDVARSICSYCDNVATKEEEFCGHIISHKGQILPRIIGGRRESVLVYEICRGLNFFEISYVFDPADETALMEEVVVPGGLRI